MSNALALWSTHQQKYMPVNAQHDCLRAQCAPLLNTYEIQEHRQPQCQTFCIMHLDEDHFVLNTLTLHNAHILAQLLPYDFIFIQASPLISDCAQHHQAIPQKLQEIISGKQELSQQSQAAAHKGHVEKPKWNTHG